MAKRQTRLPAVEPNWAELLPTAAARAAFEDASAAIEAGLLVRDLRKEAGLTQAALAQRLGVTQARVSAVEKGEGRDGPSYALLKRIAVACGTAWPLGTAAEVPDGPATRRRRGLSGEMVIVRTDSSTHHSQRMGPPVLDAAGRTLGDVLTIVVAPRQGATFTRLHYDWDKAAFVADTGSKRHAGGGSRKTHGRPVER